MNQENQCLEWKESWRDEYLKWIAGFANTFFRAGMIESWGRGVSKIIAVCEQFNLPKPTYSTSFGGLMITFFSLVEMSGKMSGKILELIKKNPEITSSQLAKKTRLTIRTIERNIKELRVQNKIERVGAGNGTHWKIID